MRLVPENRICAEVNCHVDPKFHGGFGFIGRGTGGGRTLTRGKDLAAFGVARHKCRKLLATKEAHHRPGIRPTTEACITGHFEKLRRAIAGEDHFVLAETVHNVGAVMGKNIFKIAREVMRPAVGKIGDAGFNFGIGFQVSDSKSCLLHLLQKLSLLPRSFQLFFLCVFVSQWLKRSSHNCIVTYARGLFNDLIGAYHFGVPITRVFECALLGFIIHTDETEAFGEAMPPFEVIH